MADPTDKEPVPPLDHRRRTDIVLKRFVEGMSIPGIVRYLKREYGIDVGRDVPYQDIARGTKQRWLTYNAPRTDEIGRELIARRKELLDVFVPSFGEGMATVNAAASLCASAIKDIARAKVRGITLGNPDKGIDRWRFPVKVHTDTADGPVVRNFADVDFGEVEDDQVEVQPMRITVRIGFSGGKTMSLTCGNLGNAIAAKIEDWEGKLKTLVFHTLRDADHKDGNPTGVHKRRFKIDLQFVVVNLSSGFDSSPGTNPISFLSAMLQDPMLAPRTTVEIFNAMPFVEVGKCRQTIAEIEPLREVREDYDRHGFDIILTSGGCLSDPHSTYRRYYKDKRVRQLLEKEGVVGDFMWLPITRDEPFSLKALRKRLLEGNRPDRNELAELIKYRPMTLLDLNDVADHVSKRRDVFCVLAPCGVCGLEKSDVARALLSQIEGRGLVTHFVLDRGTAGCTIEDLK